MKNRNDGFSLIEVMVTLGIMGVMALGIASVSNYMNLSSKNTKAHTGSMALQSSLLTTIMNPNLCSTRILNGSTTQKLNIDGAGNATDTPLIIQLDDGAIAQAGAKLTNYSVTVAPTPGGTPASTPFPLPNGGIYFHADTGNNFVTTVVPVASPSPMPIPAGSKLYRGTLMLDLSKGANVNDGLMTGGSSLKEAAVGGMEIAVNAANQIVGCQSTASADQCIALHSYYNPNTGQCSANYPCTTPPNLLFEGYQPDGVTPICGQSSSAGTPCNVTTLSWGAGSACSFSGTISIADGSVATLPSTNGRSGSETISCSGGKMTISGSPTCSTTTPTPTATNTPSPTPTPTTTSSPTPTATPSTCGSGSGTWSWSETAPGNSSCHYTSDATWVVTYTALTAVNPPAGDMSAFNAAISAHGPNGPLWCGSPPTCVSSGTSGTLTWFIMKMKDTDPTSPCHWSGSVTYCAPTP